MGSAAYTARRRATAVACGLCLTCCARLPRAGLKTCDSCLAAVKDRRRRMIATHAGRERLKARKRAARQQLHARRRAAGLCVGCGTSVPFRSRIHCRTCLDKIYERQKRWAARQQANNPGGLL